MEKEEATVSEETPVEETTPESAPETETPSETETAPADVSDQPVEEVKKPRAEQRIHELSKRLKDAEQKADYWEKFNAPEPVTPMDEPQGEYLTADQIADSVLRKQQIQQYEKDKSEANKEMQKDILVTLEKHPDLEGNDKLSRTVFSYAQANNMRISDAADEIKAQIEVNENKVKKELLASRSGRLGVTTPSGGKVSTGEEKIDISSLSDEEKAANWNKILDSYSK